MTAITAPPVQADVSELVQVLCAEPLGKALWERAQYAVLARKQAERVEQLEQRVRDFEHPPIDTSGQPG